MHRTETPAERRYYQHQETVRKDIERMFGVRQSRFEILRQEMRYCHVQAIICISNTCIILHNLIVRMQQNGSFCDKAAGNDIVMQFY